MIISRQNHIDLRGKRQSCKTKLHAKLQLSSTQSALESCEPRASFKLRINCNTPSLSQACCKNMLYLWVLTAGVQQSFGTMLPVLGSLLRISAALQGSCMSSVQHLSKCTGTHRFAELAGDAALLAGGIAPKHVLSPEARADRALLKGVIDLRAQPIQYVKQAARNVTAE
jgi:hypothetical protein